MKNKIYAVVITVVALILFLGFFVVGGIFFSPLAVGIIFGGLFIVMIIVWSIGVFLSVKDWLDRRSKR